MPVSTLVFTDKIQHIDWLMDLVPHTQFSTELIPEEGRFDVWRDSMSVLFEVERKKEHAQSPFVANLEAFMFDQIMLARTTSNSAYYRRQPKDIKADGIDMIMIQLFLKGEVEFQHGKNRSFIKPGDILVYDLSREVSNFNTSFDNISVLFPRELIDEYIPAAALWHGQILPRDQPMTNLLRSHMMSLYEFGPNITNESCDNLQRALLNLTSSAFQASTQNIARAAEIIAATQLREIKKYIHKHLHHPNLTPESIGQAFGFSRAQLYRVAEPLDGITHYIQKQRLKRCWKELNNPGQNHMTITELAFKWGYNDAGTFTRNFKKAFGMLPKDARTLGKLNQTSDRNSPSIQSLEINRSYEDWVRSLAD